MKKALGLSIIVTALIALFLFTACEPITRQLIAAVEDDYSPAIIVTSPSEGSIYYSTIDVTGRVDDDSLSSGDNLGLLSSFSFEIAADPDHRGRIDIDSSGVATKDTGYGNVDIVFDPADRSFSFSVATSDLGYPPQLLYLRITAQDFNGNETTESIQLVRSEGPFIDLVQPATTTYVKEGSFTVGGTVADSYQHFVEATAAGDPISAAEVATLKLEIPLLGVDAELDIAGGETTVSLFPRAGSLDYVPGTRDFQSLIDLNSGDNAITSLTIFVTATDLNGNETLETRSMTQEVDLGPVIYVIPSLLNDIRTTGDYYYTGNPASAAQPLLHVNGSTRTRLSSLNVVGRMYTRVLNRYLAVSEVTLTSGAYDATYNVKTHGNTYVWDPLIYLRDIFDFNIPLAGSTFNAFDGRGTAEVSITATDATPDALSTTLNWLIREDSDSPVFSSEDIITSTGTSHVGTVGAWVDLSFNVADGSFETGLDPTTLSGSVAGIVLSSGNFDDDGGGNYSVNVALDTASQGTGALDISISASDYLGNTASVNEGDFPSVTLYSGTPSLTNISIAADNAPADYAKPGDWITLTVTADQDLDPGELVATIAGQTASISGSGSTLTAHAQIPGGYSTSPVEYDVTAFENMVGTAGTPPSPLSSIFTGSDVTLITGSPSITAVSVVADAAPTDAAKPGDSITMTVTSTQDLDPGALDVEIAGVTATISGSGSTLTAQATIPGAYSTSPVGYVINGFENIVGTAGTVPSPLSSVVTSPDITLYADPPDLTTRTVTTATGSDRYAASGETITVTIVSDQPLDHAPTVDIGGNSVTATGSGTNWSASTTNPSDGEGSVDLEFTDVVNIVGASSSPATITGVSSGDNVLYYPGLPTISGVSMTLVEVGGGSHPDDGDIVTLVFTVDNSRILQSDPTVTFSSGATPLTPVTKDGGTSAPDYTYEYVVQTADLTLADPISYTIDFTDAAGTAGTQFAATSTVDLTP